jgi:hypothetical protein
MKKRNILRRMIREEWRMNSNLYSGRRFAAFPFMIMIFTAIFGYATINYSTLGPEIIGEAMVAVSAFLGLAVGSIGFSSKDAVKNILGSTNYIVYSSRTLPVSERSLLGVFVVKDLIFYTSFFLIPLAIGGLITAGTAVTISVLYMMPSFVAGLTFSFFLARIGSKGSIHILNYYQLEKISPVAGKSILDVFRSTGGVLKIFFSLSILTGFYWYFVLSFPAADLLLQNPLLSFSVMIGLLNLSIYNWINKFDSLNDYTYLPLDKQDLISAKAESFLIITIPLTLIIISASYIFYPEHLLLSLASGIIMTLYNLAVAIYTTGLNPNRELYQSDTFLKYITLEIVFAGPLLALSMIYTQAFAWMYYAVLASAGLISIYALNRITIQKY